MADERLHDALLELHEALGAGAPIDEDDRALLRLVADDVDRALEEEGFAERLKHRADALATEFEAEHPDLSRMLSEVVAALARMGI